MEPCPMCGKPVIGRKKTAIYCSLKCTKLAHKLKERQRHSDPYRVKKYSVVFNPMDINSFYEKESERRQRLGRKRL